ncbi:hypothetical protein N7474_000567 [Penicillium riverlandense]|uniref:uncharacterized protein n=1 Tax=Penicillium riverlandense TaxID=1903569 RepID=UPI002547017D|nr:uncharacterized protein N7474_000567 [Penicillium riverlandense]KAJ5832256.1 hypothetical protein N7474_000567 [Penicillium riverlandense]
MSYIHPSWNYAGHAGIPMDQPIAYDPSMVPPAMMHPIDGYMYPHPPMDMMDYYHQPIMDYEEYAENLSRPRLTKEQVETLEAQFQAHPKPSSNVKRQLAAQTNLSLPRVANWFQNRRAKAKQQKRQEEFEKMQKAKAEAEEAARQKSETLDQLSESRQSGTKSKEEPEKSSPVKKAPEASTSEGPSKSPTKSLKSASKHHKTKSETAREATFASLQRALNAAVAARDRFRGKDSRAKKGSTEDEEGDMSPTTMAPPKAPNSSHGRDHSGHAVLSAAFPDWDAKEEPTSWGATSSPDETIGYNTSEATSFTTTSQPLHDISGSHRNQDAFAGAHYHQAGEWDGANAGSEIGIAYSTYSMPMQAPGISVTRRESDTMSNSLEGIGICTPGQPGLSQSLPRAGGASWREPAKELDLAARRKRPRPAAIGTSGARTLAPSTSMSSLSPTNRKPSSGAGHSVRQSKSTQSLNSRYAGVRKVSAAQRSPLNFSTFSESGTMKSTKAEMLRPSVSSTTLAPPTPLTPQDLQHFMPNSPTDSNYCLSAHSATQFFPTSQPMQVNIASPPTTPMDLYSHFQYQNIAPPMSAPAHVTNFPEYAAACDPVPMSARSWTDAPSLASPDFPAGLQVPQSSHVSPMGYDSAIEHTGHSFGIEPVSGSPSLIYSVEDTDMPGSTDRKRAEFMMPHEIPEHRDAHHYMAHQLPGTQKPKAYTFANNATPHSYPA